MSMFSSFKPCFFQAKYIPGQTRKSGFVRPIFELLEDRCVPAPIMVRNAFDGNPAPLNSLRWAVSQVTPVNNTIVFNPGMLGQTIQLTAPLTINNDVTINNTVFGITLNGFGIVINAGVNVTINNLKYDQGEK